MLHSELWSNISKICWTVSKGFQGTGVTTEANSAYNKNGDIWFTYTEHKLGFFLLTLFFPEGQLGPCKLKGTLGLPQFCPWQLLNGCLKPVNYIVPKYIKRNRNLRLSMQTFLSPFQGTKGWKRHPLRADFKTSRIQSLLDGPRIINFYLPLCKRYKEFWKRHEGYNTQLFLKTYVNNK